MFISKVPSEFLTHRLDCPYYHPEAMKLDYKFREYGNMKLLSQIISSKRKITNGVRGPDIQASQYCLIRLQDCQHWGINFDNCLTISEKQFNENRRCQLFENDIVVAIGGYVGNASIARNVKLAVIGQHSAVLPYNPNGYYDERYLLAYLNSAIAEIQFQRYVSGSIQAGINLEDLRDIPIPIPNKLAQSYIGDKVRLTERLRTRARQIELFINDKFSFLLANLKPKSKSWRVHRNNIESYRLNTSHYDAVIVDMLDKAKKQIDLLPLASLFGKRGISGGATPQGAEYPEKGIFFVRVQNVKPLRLDLSDAAYLTPAQDAELKRSRCQAGEIILSITGYPGVAAVVLEDDLPVNINQHSVRFDVCQGWEAEYIAAALNTTFLKMQVDRLAIGGTRIALDYASISNLLIPVFPEATRKVIAHNVAISNRAIRESERLTTAAKLLVEALIEGKLTEDELKNAQLSLEKGAREPDKAILSRLTRKGIDVKDEPPLFPDIDALYEIIDQLDKDGEEEI
ncbi:hypothetical protein NIES4071_06780 [Calothrix sp. NIES-4071]|nr:hypothetical protein NIES4071_06780 [Calothrix sp. NIES-4071]BAZ55020.1 hypothetical protein NIES4105_06740 [Calothrix sp. NIES-4105]